MNAATDISQSLAAAVCSAAASRTPLRIVGGGSKTFYGPPRQGEPLEVAGHSGIVSHEPTELVLTARAGTLLTEIERTLDKQNQMLGFEPPHFGEGATLGGAIACGFSGPRRPYAGAARDFVLGVKLINGKGEILSFGGQVMKNVAGYDVSRLMVGALGTLGVLLEVSLKVLPKPAEETTVAFEADAGEALTMMNVWAGKPFPLSAACHIGEKLYVRLSGTGGGVDTAQKKLGGEAIKKSEEFWHDLREHKRNFFLGNMPLWRLSVPPAAPRLSLPGKWILDWGGAQRWLKSDAPAEEIRQAAEAAGGHATLFRGGDRNGAVFQPLPPSLLKLHQSLAQAFDPEAVFHKVFSATAVASQV